MDKYISRELRQIVRRPYYTIKPSKEAFENFLHSTDIYLNMYRSWIVALEKMSEKSKDLNNLTSNPEVYKEFCDLWIKMYEKAFDIFFEDMPMVGPMKETMGPIKIAAKIYADALCRCIRQDVQNVDENEFLFCKPG